MDPSNAIEIRNMSKSFKVQHDGAKTLKEFLTKRHRGKKHRIQVLNDINLDIKKGDTVGLIGTNGSGKSTLLKLITKIIYPDSGTIKTDGKVTSLLELGAGFHPDFTGRENIYFNAAIFGLTEKEIDQRIDKIIEFSELGKFIDEPIRTYSSGMYMRLAFSVAINVDADILLIDEILAVGDQHFQEKCFEKLRQLRDDGGKTIVIVSHSLDMVRELCTRVVWLYHGSFRMDGTPGIVIDEYLKQVALDNVAEKKRKIQESGASYSGLVYIDGPRNYTHFSDQTSKMPIGGWKVSDCENAVFEVKIGNKIVTDLEPMRRDDVVQIYSEEYGGFMDPDTVGWTKGIDMKDYLDQRDDQNRITVSATLKDDQGNVIAYKDVYVVYDGEKEAA